MISRILRNLFGSVKRHHLGDWHVGGGDLPDSFLSQPSVLGQFVKRFFLFILSAFRFILWLFLYTLSFSKPMPLGIRLLIKYSWLGLLGSIGCAILFVIIAFYLFPSSLYGMPNSPAFADQWRYWAFMTFDVLYCFIAFAAAIRFTLYGIGEFFLTIVRPLSVVIILAVIGGFIGYLYVVNRA